MGKVDLDEARGWQGFDVVDHEGERLGRLTGIYIDSQSERPVFAVVRTGLFGLRSVLVPVAGAFEEQGSLVVEPDRQTIRQAPHLRRDEPLTPELEEQLYEHYGIQRPPDVPNGPRLVLWQFESAR